MSLMRYINLKIKETKIKETNIKKTKIKKTKKILSYLFLLSFLYFMERTYAVESKTAACNLKYTYYNTYYRIIRTSF